MRSRPPARRTATTASGVPRKAHSPETTGRLASPSAASGRTHLTSRISSATAACSTVFRWATPRATSLFAIAPATCTCPTSASPLISTSSQRHRSASSPTQPCCRPALNARWISRCLSFPPPTRRPSRTSIRLDLTPPRRRSSRTGTRFSLPECRSSCQKRKPSTLSRPASSTTSSPSITSAPTLSRPSTSCTTTPFISATAPTLCTVTT